MSERVVIGVLLTGVQEALRFDSEVAAQKFENAVAMEAAGARCCYTTAGRKVFVKPARVDMYWRITDAPGDPA